MLTSSEALGKAIALHEAGNLIEAERFYKATLSVKPDQFDALYYLGLLEAQRGRFEDAHRLIGRALEINPQSAGANLNNGNVLMGLNRHGEALASYEKALSVRPDYAEALNNRGAVLLELKRYEAALASCDRALAIKPDYAEAFNNRGNALMELNRHVAALASFDRALAIKPEYAEALYNRGNTLQGLNRHEEALASYDRALAIKPDYADALNNRGITLQDLNRHEEALAGYAKALAIAPDLIDAHWNEGLCRLLMGDFERGWAKFELRWGQKDFPASRHNFSQPLWLGKEDVSGKTILLHAERGYGDTIQFCRYTEVVAQKGAQVILEVQPPLKSLLSGIRGAQQVIAEGEPLPVFDFHCPLLSLPLALNTRLTTIPASTPYLYPSAASILKWEARLGPKDAPRVGIAWSGSSRNNRLRSIALNGLLPLTRFGVRLVSLKQEVAAEDLDVLAENREILHFGAELEDFSDTAALASLMDLVVSSDTSVAHLAGALGKPVWILLPLAPDWRWLLNREDSPWYPTARLFRQTEIGDWDSVIQKVTSELAQSSVVLSARLP